MTSNQVLNQWVEEVRELTQPDRIHWCTGSAEESQQLIEGMLEAGEFIELNRQTHPGCYLHRSSPDDVARVEHLTSGLDNIWSAFHGSFFSAALASTVNLAPGFRSVTP